MDFLTIEKETEDEFQSIAQTLFDKYAIRTYEALYRLTEIEFYWNSPLQVDNSTYKRKHVDPKTGDWFFHYSGVDIAIRNEKTGGYGGILIRGIYDVNRNIYPQQKIVTIESNEVANDGGVLNCISWNIKISPDSSTPWPTKTRLPLER